MTYEQRQYATGGILLVMVAVAAFILGIAYQNNKVEIKNRVAPLLGQMQAMANPSMANDQEEMMANRKRAQLMQIKHCRMQKRHRQLEQRLERLERMQMMVISPYQAADYWETNETEAVLNTPQSD